MTQVLLYSLLAILLVIWLRRMLLMRSVTQYSAAQLAGRLQEKPSPVLLDVRTTAEHRSGAIKGSVHIPLQELRSRIGEVRKFGEREVVVYCQTGSRSLSAAGILRKQGITVANLKGGIAEWNFAGLR